ncbi:MAG: response regulator transcription factor [Armatimonadetes bacterium]|nr:response regulator transcription factor [Armatimonadota bacterium]
MTAIRVLVVDDHRLVAESIARLLQDFSDLQVVGQASTGPEAISLARQLNPSVSLMDIGMPGMGGVDATWTLTRQFPSIRSVYEGKPVLHPQIASAALQRLATRGRLGAKDPFALTQREVQILQLTVGGLDALEISRRLVLSPHTVRNHLKSAYRKLGVHGKTEAAIHAFRQGIAKA